VSVNGDYMENVLSTTVASTNSFSADTFSVTLAIGTEPFHGLTFWSSVAESYIEIFSSDMTVCLITGMADTVLIDLLQGTVKIEGRDLSSRLIDTSPEQDFVNQTAADIVTSIASKHGLAANVVPTVGMTGRFYGDNFTRLSISKFSRIRSEWDLVVQLARECEYDVYVSGQILFFEPATISGEAAAVLTPDMVSSLRVERTLWISDSPAVQMSTWSSQDLAVYRQTDGSAAGSSAYVFTGSNLTANQVSQDTARYLNEISRMRQVISVEMPWMDSASTRAPIYLYGVGSVLNGIYRVDHVERQFSASSGSRQHLILSKPNA
jgi:phage protein D